MPIESEIIQILIFKVSKTKNKIQKDPLKFLKKIENLQESHKSKSLIKQTPPKVGITIQRTISKFSKTKNQTTETSLKLKRKKDISNKKV